MSTTVGEPIPLHWRYILRPPPISIRPPELLAFVAATTTTWNVLTKVTTTKKKHARDATEGATLKGSIDTKIRTCVKRTMQNCGKEHAVFRQNKTGVEDFIRSVPVRSTLSSRRCCRLFQSPASRNRKERKGLKCWLDFERQDFSFSGRYACPTRNFQRRK